MKISESVKEFIDLRKIELSKSTSLAYGNAMKAFSFHLANIGIETEDDLSKLSVENFISFPAYLVERGYSKSTNIVYMAGVKSFLDWLTIKGILGPDYQSQLRLKMSYKTAGRRREEKLPRFPQLGEAEKMIEAVRIINEPSPRKERDLALVLMLFTTGCRNNELVQLKISAVDFEHNSAVVIGKGSKERRVFFNQETREALELYWKARGFRDKNHPVFARHDKGIGNKISKLTTASIRNIITDVAKIAGIDPGKFTPHYFRHNFAIRVLRKTHDLALVQDLMGHATPASTRVYAKIYPDDLEAAHKTVF